jgi:hypothetical protein
MMTRQARLSAKIIGFDTHMILEAAPARHSNHHNGHQPINPDITPLCQGPVTAVPPSHRRPRKASETAERRPFSYLHLRTYH